MKMLVDIIDFIKQSGIENGQLYPGRRLVKPCPQQGKYKSHCVIFDWRTSDKLKIEVKAGQTGKDLPPEILKNYPVSFEAPTYVDIDFSSTDSENEDTEEEEGKSSSGKGGGGKKPARKKLEESEASLLSLAKNEFAKAIEGKIPEMGRITEMVVMGMKVSSKAYEKVMNVFKHQIAKGKISGTDLLAEAGKFVTKYTPPGFMKPKGDEDVVYKYDRAKVDAMFTMGSP